MARLAPPPKETNLAIILKPFSRFVAAGENIKALKAALPWVNGHNAAPQHLHLLQRSICTNYCL
jgi:hypothetical protein